MANSEAEARLGWQAESINESIRGQPPSHSAKHGVRVKVRHTEGRKENSPEANCSQDNLS